MGARADARFAVVSVENGPKYCAAARARPPTLWHEPGTSIAAPLSGNLAYQPAPAASQKARLLPGVVTSAIVPIAAGPLGIGPIPA